MFKIAEYFSEDARRFAATAEYTSYGGLGPRAAGTFQAVHRPAVELFDINVPVSEACPIGLMMVADGPDPRSLCPYGTEVARWLVRKGSIHESDFAEASSAAAEFIGQFDSGKVDDLAEALGVDE